MRISFRTTATAALIAFGFQAHIAVAEDIVTDPNLILQAQEIMYNLNYDFGVPDGVNGPPTREVIRTLQKKLGQPVTGDLTVKLLEQLKKQKIPTTWGAVSGAVDGGWGAVWNYKTRKAAERKASDLCKAKSKKKWPGARGLRSPVRRRLPLGRQEEMGLARKFGQQHADRQARCAGGLPCQQERSGAL